MAAPALTAKIACLVLFAVITLICGLLPLLFSRLARRCSSKFGPGNNRWRKRSELIVSCIMCLGGGVLLATIFTHMLPEIREVFEEAEEHDVLPDIGVPMGEMVLCFGFFMVFFIEEVAHACMSHDRRRKHRKNQRRDAERGLDNAAADVAKEGKENETPSESSSDRDHDHDHRNHDHATDIVSQKSFRAYLVVVALSVHSVFEGLAVGFEETPRQVWILFSALLAHKVVVAFCIGQQLLGTNRSVCFIISTFSVFAFASPLGVGLGIVISNSVISGGSLLATGILQSLAAGTILYVIFFELLGPELQKRNWGLVKFAAALIGFGLMLVIHLTSGHSHSHGGHSGEVGAHHHDHHGHGHEGHNHAAHGDAGGLHGYAEQAIRDIEERVNLDTVLGHDHHHSADEHAHGQNSGHDHSDHSEHDHFEGDHSDHHHGDSHHHDHTDHAGHDHSQHDHTDHADHDHSEHDHSEGHMAPKNDEHAGQDHSQHDHPDHADHDHSEHDHSEEHMAPKNDEHAGHDHSQHDHTDHADHDHSEHDHSEGHMAPKNDEHAGHDHSQHDHTDHADHDHSEHDHSEGHMAPKNDEHAGHDQSQHDHADHADHDHSEHDHSEGHMAPKNDEHAGHDHSQHDHTEHADHDHSEHDHPEGDMAPKNDQHAGHDHSQNGEGHEGHAHSGSDSAHNHTEPSGSSSHEQNLRDGRSEEAHAQNIDFNLTASNVTKKDNLKYDLLEQDQSNGGHSATPQNGTAEQENVSPPHQIDQAPVFPGPATTTPVSGEEHNHSEPERSAQANDVKDTPVTTGEDTSDLEKNAAAESQIAEGSADGSRGEDITSKE